MQAQALSIAADGTRKNREGEAEIFRDIQESNLDFIVFLLTTMSFYF